MSKEEKERFDLHIPVGTKEMMKKAMVRQRQRNQTAFIISAIEAMCKAKKDDSTVDRLEQIVVLLTKNAERDREEAERRHLEVKAYLDAIGQWMCEDKDDYKSFLEAVETAKSELVEN